jgi:predicted kinase
VAQVTRVVLINGVPASGKSTLARRYAREHPLTLALDIDTVRRMLGGWMDRLEESGLAARRIAVEMVRTHVGSGRDVVIPQFLGRVEFVRTLAGLCDDVGADFVEIVLLSSPDEAVDRFVRRTAAAAGPGDGEAAALVEQAGGADAQIRMMYRQLLGVVQARPASRIVATVPGDADATYVAMVAQINPPIR